MRAIIERVTCDKCGEIRHYEKFDMGSMIARVEALTDWLRQHGWTVTQDGSRRIDTCPACTARERG